MSAIQSTLRTGLLFACLLLGLGPASQAQRFDRYDAGFRFGDYSIAAGVGYGMDYGFAPAGTEQPAYMLTVDRGSIEIRPGTIGLGGILAYKEAAQTINEGHISSAWSCVTAAGRATFHVTPLSEIIQALDVYAGVMAGVQYWNYSDNYSEKMGLAYKERGLRPTSAPFVGMKCKLSKAVGIWAEAGWDVAAVKGGVYVGF